MYMYSLTDVCIHTYMCLRFTPCSNNPFTYSICICMYLFVGVCIYTYMCLWFASCPNYSFTYSMYINICICVCLSMCVCKYTYMCLQSTISPDMGWLRLVGSSKLQVSFAKEPYKRDYILQKKPVILRSLLIVATPLPFFLFQVHNYMYMYVLIYMCMHL